MIFCRYRCHGTGSIEPGRVGGCFIDKATGAVIRENARRCHVDDRCRILKGDVSSSLRALQGQTFDYIFMDPPYRKGYINEILAQVFACGLPAEEAIIIAEHSVSEPPDLSLFEGKCELWKEKRWERLL